MSLKKHSSFSFAALLMVSSLSSMSYAQTPLAAPQAFGKHTAPHKVAIAKKKVVSTVHAAQKTAVKKVVHAQTALKKKVKTSHDVLKKDIHREVIKKHVVEHQPVKATAVKEKHSVARDIVSKQKNPISKIVVAGTAVGATAVAAGVATAAAAVHNTAVATDTAVKTTKEVVLPSEVTTKPVITAKPAPIAAVAPSSAVPTEDDRPVVEEHPTYAFLKTRMVNMRRGPGEEYPIDWVYSRRGLPVRVLVRYRMWRKVVDPYGTTGWMKLITLHPGRHFMVTGTKPSENMPDEKHMREVGGDPVVRAWVDPKANPASDEAVLYKSAYSRKRVAYLKPGVVGQILRCKGSSNFCDVKVNGYAGSILKSRIWGISQGEEFEAVKPSFFR